VVMLCGRRDGGSLSRVASDDGVVLGCQLLIDPLLRLVSDGSVVVFFVVLRSGSRRRVIVLASSSRPAREEVFEEVGRCGGSVGCHCEGEYWEIWKEKRERETEERNRTRSYESKHVHCAIEQ